MSNLLENFKEYLHKIDQLNLVTVLLYWDMRTGAPRNGLDSIGDALARFSTEQFEMTTADELGAMLDSLSAPDEFNRLDDTYKFIVTRMKRDYDKQKRIPTDFYNEFVKVQTASETAWEDAKNASDFSIFAPHLERIINMTKEMCQYTDSGKDVYDTLLDQYEEGIDSAAIDVLFDDLKKELIPLVQKVLAANQPDDSNFACDYDIDSQKKVQDMLLKYIGFDFNSGSVGESEHPFTLNFSSKDARVTNHYYRDNAISAIFSAIHEGGHAVFEQNVNPDYDGTVAGSCNYMGVHESQSRFYENILGRNINFWIPIYDKLGELLPAFQNISLEQFHKEITHVRNSFIRTDADELTYCFHIIIRYEMEKAIFRDNVPVSELPALWNKKMHEYLNITPSNDAEGILQDMHWSDGSFGYFPSYLLGTIYDGMFYDAISAELGDIDSILANGDILKITQWLNENIHYYGSTRTPKEVIQNVCHKEVSAEPIIRFFKKRYSDVYDLT